MEEALAGSAVFLMGILQRVHETSTFCVCYSLLSAQEETSSSTSNGMHIYKRIPPCS